ncbi:ClbS/DfsB family four-helix bundle protein [Ktedonosporobacter rubrisoli]|uniref:ClbS/DfsB family four-helix bundle protein n=1 Tax=Ktedonosporobacter rubrisoli TaxID=2509675 RepID=A0A4P6JKF7_KTERU|nr:DinB family protein [Ktedonosporobacter rubrisoli]QBD75634.1 ClbS/DfsB family four-helix bundle protein [Ktedonosporobacter rubrisoli]
MTVQPFKSLILELLQQGHHDEEAFLQELSEAELNANGTWKLWSVKDHMAHKTFWHQHLIEKLTAILQHQALPPGEEDEEQLNSITFEKHKLQPFSALHAESERVYVQLIKIVEQLSEEELTTSRRFSAISDDYPLYTVFLGSCYEHDEEHLAYYYKDRHDLLRAIQIRERCASRIMQAEIVPDWVKGSFLYNLACFYTEQKQWENAAARLQEAVARNPDLKERAKSDPELAALHNQSA